MIAGRQLPPCLTRYYLARHSRSLRMDEHEALFHKIVTSLPQTRSYTWYPQVKLPLDGKRIVPDFIVSLNPSMLDGYDDAPAAHLFVELDGYTYHSRERDEQRDRDVLDAYGTETIRLPSAGLWHAAGTGAVVAMLVSEIDSRKSRIFDAVVDWCSTHQPSPWPSPLAFRTARKCLTQLRARLRRQDRRNDTLYQGRMRDALDGDLCLPATRDNAWAMVWQAARHEAIAGRRDRYNVSEVIALLADSDRVAARLVELARSATRHVLAAAEANALALARHVDAYTQEPDGGAIWRLLEAEFWATRAAELRATHAANMLLCYEHVAGHALGAAACRAQIAKP